MAPGFAEALSAHISFSFSQRPHRAPSAHFWSSFLPDSLLFINLPCEFQPPLEPQTLITVASVQLDCSASLGLHLCALVTNVSPGRGLEWLWGSCRSSFMNHSPSPPTVQILETVVSCILFSFAVEFGGELVIYQLIHRSRKCKVSSSLSKTISTRRVSQIDSSCIMSHIHVHLQPLITLFPFAALSTC